MAERARILIADDEEIFLHSIAILLERAGYLCTQASDAATVIELLKKEQYDLLITDIKMPGNPHLELIHELPHLAEGLPVILVTAYPSLDSAIPAIQLPVVAYLVKPFEISELLTEVHNALLHTEAYRAVQHAQQRWQEWGQDLARLSQVIQPRLQGAADKIVEAVVGSTVHSLTNCLSDFQELKGALTSPDGLTATVPTPLGRTEVTPVFPPLIARGVDERQGTENEVLPFALQEELQQLSVREREVLHLLLACKRTQVIAKMLAISPHTVRNHLRAIFTKLDVHSQIELIEKLSPYATCL